MKLSGRAEMPTQRCTVLAIMASSTRVEGVTVLFPDPRSDVTFVGGRVLAAGTASDHGALCLMSADGSSPDDLTAGGEADIETVCRVALVGGSSAAPASVVGVCGDELLAFGFPGLKRTAELFRASLKLRAVSARTGGSWV